MSRILKLSAVLMALLLAVGLFTSCGTNEERRDALLEYLSSEEEELTLEDNLKLAWSPLNLDDEFFTEATRGFEDYCKENKYTALVANPDDSEQEQYSEFENWVAMDVDAIAAAPVNEAMLTDIVEEAKAGGIIVSGFYSKIPQADFNLTLDEYDLGYTMGQNALRWIDEKLTGRASALLILNDTDEALKTRGSGIKDALSEAGSVSIAATQSADSVPDAKSAAEDSLRSYTNINVVVCINDDYAIGVLEVTDDLDIENNSFYIGGAGYTEQALQDMNEPGAYLRSTVNLSAYDNGRLLAQMMAEAVVNGVEENTTYFEPQSYWQKALGWN